MDGYLDTDRLFLAVRDRVTGIHTVQPTEHFLSQVIHPLTSDHPRGCEISRSVYRIYLHWQPELEFLFTVFDDLSIPTVNTVSSLFRGSVGQELDEVSSRIVIREEL